MPKKRLNPRRIPLPKNAINKDAIIEEAMKDDMEHAWLLVAGPLLDAGYELKPLAEAVNQYIEKKNAPINRKSELLRVETAIGLTHPSLDSSHVKSLVELEAFKRKVERVAINTAICVIYLGLEHFIPEDTLKRVFFSADLTLAEIEKGLTTFNEIERELLVRVADLGMIESN